MTSRKELLELYNAKRDFTKTAEPAGKVVAGKNQYRYIIQKHAARRLHFDFRLELNGVLKSWAVTRGPSLDPHEKRLAVEVEDHPIDYGTFEGIIPAGEYGGGTVMLWDIGTWEPIGDPTKQLNKGSLHFRLHGERLKGEWTLVRMNNRKREASKKNGRTNWLLIKKDDDVAVEGDGEGLIERFISSITTDRSMDAIAKASDAVWGSQVSKKGTVATKKTAVNKTKTEQGKDKMPGFIPSQLATLVDDMPIGEKWVHEIKFDGYRLQVHIDQGQVRLFTRSGLNWTRKFPMLAKSFSELNVQNAILDGEVVAVNEQGVSSFKALQDALSDEKDDVLQFYAFDLLYMNGSLLTKQPLIERKELLAEMLASPLPLIFYSDHFSSDDGKFLDHACSLHMEGVISKLKDAPYQSERSKSWVKSKCIKRQEFVIGGFTLPSKGKGIGALILGYYDNDELHYAGRVGTGFNHDTSLNLRERLEKLRAKDSSYAEPLPGIARRGVQYVRPELVCEVQYAEWTESGVLRHPSFQGLREDKPAEAVGKDHIEPIKKIEKQTETIVETVPSREILKKRTSHTTGDMFHGIKISSTDKLLYPEEGITKGMVAEYYSTVADYVLQYVANRPLSIVRCTSGINKKCFFQRHNTLKGVHIHDVKLPDKPKEPPYLMIKDAKGLLSLAQLGVIEMHMWNSHAANVLLPDQMVFDLDPDPAVEWNKVVDAAFQVRGFLQQLGLQSFVKTTGGKGLHVVVPIKPEHSWDKIKPFTKAIAETMEANDPRNFIATMSKAKRKGKIFVDYLRNDETATAVAPFSLRARPGATVATPITWDELKSGINPKDFTLKTIPERLVTLKNDPWEGFSTLKQSIPNKFLDV